MGQQGNPGGSISNTMVGQMQSMPNMQGMRANQAMPNIIGNAIPNSMPNAGTGPMQQASINVMQTGAMSALNANNMNTNNVNMNNMGKFSIQFQYFSYHIQFYSMEILFGQVVTSLSKIIPMHRCRTTLLDKCKCKICKECEIISPYRIRCQTQSQINWQIPCNKQMSHQVQ